MSDDHPKPPPPAPRSVAQDQAGAAHGPEDASADDIGSDDIGPDDVSSDDMWPDDELSPIDTGEFFLGSEAAVPARDFGPLPIESHFPDPETAARQLGELERRMRASQSPAFPIETRRQVPFEQVWTRLRRVAMRGRSAMVDDFGRDPLYSARYAPILHFLYRRYFRVAVEGIEHVPTSGPAIVVANHSGLVPYDGLLAMHALRYDHPARRDARPLIEDYVFHFPYLGTLINRLGGVRACPENAERLLERDQVVIVFPEGIKGIGKLYKNRYELQRFGRGGVVRIALRTGTPVIPLAIVGAEDTNPMIGKFTWLSGATGIPFLPISPTGLAPLPVKWSMHFGPPIDVAGQYGAARADDRLLVNRLTDQVRSTIQRMVEDMLARRSSVIFG